MLKNILLFLCFVIGATNLVAQETEYALEKDIPYYADDIIKTDTYISERCKLDVYYPKDGTNVATVVWFHGGGITAGNKNIPEGLLKQNVIVVTVNYRLYPKVKQPEYIKDAAAAVAWTFNTIEKYGGRKDAIFVSGHSAGGYLASMVSLDKSYLAAFNIDANDIAGLIPFSGHTITHFTVRKEQGIEGTQPTIDKYAPLFHVRKDAPATLLITGDRERELLGRYEEVAYFYRMMKVVGHEDITLYEMDGYGHNMVYPAIPMLVKFVSDKTAKIIE
ncbi:alpha/beta hydrolase fold domain-containing protein [Aurantibacter crassamenti]|uniref:alpha/beta hydrolase n=1 Tax=Aurantibacter crassamenti TaxID=1837375 RepID=UPI0019397EBC|nr:alpha/beta hydrolase fold domain-containing protein [Aurantibacter crassamenti]MBM1105639.1 alpha/beta hydrolase fold domain-containing protein [Aurantibacter crassamenti]